MLMSVDQNIADYIKAQRNKGFSDMQIRQALLQAGHEQAAVEEHLRTPKTYDYRIAAAILIVALAAASGIYFSVVKTGEDHLANGNLLREQGRFEEAIVEYTKAIEKGEGRAYIGRGWSYYDLWLYEQAIEDLEKAVELMPQSDMAYRGLGWSYLRSAKITDEAAEPEKALSAFNTALSFNPNHIDAMIGIAKAYDLSNNINTALEEYCKIVALEPFNPTIHKELGWIYFRMRNYSAAEEHLENALALNPNDSHVKSTLGCVLIAKGNHEAGAELLFEVEKENRANEVTYECLGRYYLRKGENETAWNYYTESISMDPRYIRGHFGLGVSNMFLKNYQIAEENLLTAIDLDKEKNKCDFDAYLAWVYYYQNKTDAARQSLSNALEKEPSCRLTTEIQQLLEQYS